MSCKDTKHDPDNWSEIYPAISDTIECNIDLPEAAHMKILQLKEETEDT
jgi:hypothetical protein